MRSKYIFNRFYSHKFCPKKSQNKNEMKTWNTSKKICMYVKEWYKHTESQGKKTDLSQDPKNFTFIYVSRFLLLTAAQLNVVRVVVVVIVCGCWLCCCCRLIWLNFVGFIRLYLFFIHIPFLFDCLFALIVMCVLLLLPFFGRFWWMCVNVFWGFQYTRKKTLTHSHTPKIVVCTHTHDLL